MKKIIAFFILSVSVLVLGSSVVKSVSPKEDSCIAIHLATNNQSIPTYLDTDIHNPLYAGCPKCKGKYFINQEPENNQTLYICVKCKYQFIIKIDLH